MVDSDSSMINQVCVTFWIRSKAGSEEGWGGGMGGKSGGDHGSD